MNRENSESHDCERFQSYDMYVYTSVNVRGEVLVSVHVYQVRLDWLPLYCLDLAQPAEFPR